MRNLTMLGMAALCALGACGKDEEAEAGREVASGSFVGADGQTGSYSVRSDDDSQRVEIKTATGNAVITTGENAARALPAGLPSYPGAQVTGSVIGTDSGQSGGMVSFETPDSPDKVIAFYRSAAPAAGFKIESEVKAGETMMIGGQKTAGKGGFQISVTPQAGKSVVSVIAGGS